MKEYIDKTRDKYCLSKFSDLVDEIIKRHRDFGEISQNYINEIYGEIVPLRIFAESVNAQFVELCPKNHRFDGKLYLEGGEEIFVEITRMGVSHQTVLQLEHLKKYKYCDLNVPVKYEGTKASGNREITKQKNGKVDCTDEITRRFSDDFSKAINNKVSKSKPEDFEGALIVSFHCGDYPIRTQSMKEFLQNWSVPLESSFSEIYVVGTEWADFEKIVHKIQ